MEQQEFSKILQVVQQQIQGHINALKELGIDLEVESKKIQEKNKDDINERFDWKNIPITKKRYNS